MSIINTVGHCRDVTVFTMSRDVSSVKVERVKADYSDSNPKTSKGNKGLIIKHLMGGFFYERKQRDSSICGGLAVKGIFKSMCV